MSIVKCMGPQEREKVNLYTTETFKDWFVCGCSSITGSIATALLSCTALHNSKQEQAMQNLMAAICCKNLGSMARAAHLAKVFGHLLTSDNYDDSEKKAGDGLMSWYCDVVMSCSPRSQVVETVMVRSSQTFSPKSQRPSDYFFVDFVDFVVPLGNSFILPDAMAKWGEGISFNRSGLRFEIECGDSERKKKYHQMWEARHTRPCARGVVNVAMFRFPQLDLGVSHVESRTLRDSVVLRFYIACHTPGLSRAICRQSKSRRSLHTLGKASLSLRLTVAAKAVSVHKIAYWNLLDTFSRFSPR